MKILALQTHYRKAKDKKGREKINPGAVDWWRVDNPMRALKKLCPDWEIDIKTVLVDESGDIDAQFQEVGRKYDIIFSSYIDNPKGYAWLRALSERFNVPLVMDIDDNLFDVDEMSPVYEEYYPGSLKLFFASTVLADVDYLTVSTDPLRITYMVHRSRHDFRPEPVVMPNGIDLKVYNHPRVQGLPKDRGVVKIGWWGGWTHYSDMEMVAPAIKRVLDKYPNVVFETVGMPTDLFEGYEGRATQRGGSNTFSGWAKLWKSIQFDIAICPIRSSDFNNGKSDIKWQEAAAGMMSTVCSNFGPYKRSVKHEVTGLLANTEDEWVEMLSRLVEDSDLRARLSSAAYAEVKDKRSIESVAGRYKIMFEGIKGSERPWLKPLDQEEQPAIIVPKNKILTLGDTSV